MRGVCLLQSAAFQTEQNAPNRNLVWDSLFVSLRGCKMGLAAYSRREASSDSPCQEAAVTAPHRQFWSYVCCKQDLLFLRVFFSPICIQREFNTNPFLFSLQCYFKMSLTCMAYFVTLKISGNVAMIVICNDSLRCKLDVFFN